jgi:DNA-binding MarR family transcriptional regulator
MQAQLILLQLNPETRYPASVSPLQPAAPLQLPPAAPAGDGAADSRAPADADANVAAWRELAASHAIVSCALDRELGDRHGLGVSDFEVLERLTEAEDHKFRVQELAGAVHLSQSALSRLIGRLEQHGLVERCLCDLDRRGVYVTITPEGRRRHAEALPTQRAVLATTLPNPC